MIDQTKDEMAEAFGRDTDPLAEFESTFRDLDANAFDLFIEEDVESRDLKESSIRPYLITIEQWESYMEDTVGRHPACPKVSHAKQFALFYLNEEGNHPRTVQRKLSHLSQAFEYFQNEPAFPHTVDFNPFEAAKNKVNLSIPDEKEPPRLTIDEVATKMDEITHVRDRALIATQLKLGLRSGELCNIRLEEVNIDDRDVRQHYDGMASHHSVSDRPNSVYIPHDRDGNKSERPRVMPLDDELRHIWLQYLLVRPDNGRPWLFLSDNGGYQMRPNNVNDRWKKYWHPQYAETERHLGITAHFGRHFFTSFWTVQKDAPRELVKYMRGDVNSRGRTMKNSGDAIDSYIHTYYEDIENLYRTEIFRFTNH